MSYVAKFKTALKNPDAALRFLIFGSKFKFDEKKYIPLYNAQRQYNQENSKYSLYFDFCKRILTDSVSNNSLKKRFFENPKQLSDHELKKELQKPVNTNVLAGLSWPRKAHTMIGLMRLENLQFCVEDVIKNKIEGDLIEAGVWRGGATIFMRIILKEYGLKNKIVYVADSFEGLPPPDHEKFPADKNSRFHRIDVTNVSLEEVKNNFKLYGVLDNQVKFLKGWFKDSLKQAPCKKLSILRVDGDMYESTWEILENLYDKLSVGGYVIVDDFSLQVCVSAVNDFRSQNNITDTITSIDGCGIFWKKLIINKSD